MDEPLSNLDAKLRVQTRTQIASLTRRLGVTTVYDRTPSASGALRTRFMAGEPMNPATNSLAGRS
jgi:ABC-type uncharacterized transport system YnjBCD ATPase subunit